MNCATFCAQDSDKPKITQTTENDNGKTFKGHHYNGDVVYWQNYTYMLGPHKCKGTEYFLDKAGKKLYARNPFYAQRSDHVVRINDYPVKTIKMTS